MSDNDNAVQEAVAQEPAVQETAPVETTTPEVTDPNSENFFDEVDAEVAAGEKEDEADDTDETSPEETQGQARGEDGKFVKTEPAEEKPLAPKSENRFQKLANDNKAKDELIRQQQEQLDRLKLQETQIATEQELLNEINPETGEYYTPQEVERIAFQQTREQKAQQVSQERYRLEIQQNQRQIASEAEKVLTEFPMFDEQSKEYNAAIAAQYDQLLQQNLVFDQNNDLVGSNFSPYLLAKLIADATKANAPVYEAKAQRSTEKMLANADVSSGATQATKTKVDPMMAAFDEEASRL